MPRNMISANNELFSRLRKLLPPDTPELNAPIKRWIVTNPEEKRWLKGLTFSTDRDLHFGGHSSMCLAFFDSDVFLVGVDVQLSLPEDEFESLEVNAGIFCAAIIELKIEPFVTELTSLQLIENVFLPLEHPSPNGVEHKHSAIQEFFPPIKIFRIRAESPLLGTDSSLFRVALFAATKCPRLISLPWTSEGLEMARTVSSTERAEVPFELVLRAVLERKWEHAFLEIYRCMEFLFPFPKISELKKRLNFAGSSVEVSESIEDILGWRPIEEAAMQALFRSLQPASVETFRQALGIERSDVLDLNKAVANSLYRLRNDCVHFRPVQRRSNAHKKVKWEILLQEMLKAVNEFYSAYFPHESICHTAKLDTGSVGK